MPLARRARNRGDAERGRFLSRNKYKPTIQKERWRFLVEGKVQGVGFRQGCCRRAMDLDLSGWVRNLPDGRVEVQAEGTPMACLLYTSPSPRDLSTSRMPSSA